MADLSNKRQEQLGLESVSLKPVSLDSVSLESVSLKPVSLESVSARAVEARSISTQVENIAVEITGVAPSVSRKMITPVIDRALQHRPEQHRPQPGPETQLAHQENVELLAFKQLRQSAQHAASQQIAQRPNASASTAAQPRSKPSPKSVLKSRTRARGFTGETILDKLVNALLTVVESVMRFISQRLISRRAPATHTIIRTPPAVKRFVTRKSGLNHEASDALAANDLVNNDLVSDDLPNNSLATKKKKYSPKRPL